MKAITIKQPWASLIVTPRKYNPTLGVKNIENRTWATKFRGRVLVHASAKGWIWKSVFNYLSHAARDVMAVLGYDASWLKQLPTSAIIGSVEIVDCVINHHSIWAEKSPDYSPNHNGGIPAMHGCKKYKPTYNWVLANPILFDTPITGVKGKLSFWEYDLQICETCGQPFGPGCVE